MAESEKVVRRKARQRAYYQANRERIIARLACAHRFRKFGLTEAQYDRILRDQGGVCGLCHEPEIAMRNGKIKALAVDHDHETGIVRGLLCQRCNRALGLFRDDPDLLRKALQWLD